jgi:AcrR family transcriptional regulator
MLTQSLKLFNKHGFVNVRLQHIADAGSISVGNLAYHFKNKDEIVETLYDQLKALQEILLYEFRVVHLFEDVNTQLHRIFQLQKQYLFFYLDTLEVLRAYANIREKHRQHIKWQIQQVEWMFEFNVFRGSFQAPFHEIQYKKLAQLFWLTMDNWMYAQQISGNDYLNENDFILDMWSLMMPYLTDEGLEEFKVLNSKQFAQ